MSAVVDALRAKAEKLAVQLREATANAEAEQAAKDARNADRVAAFWANAGDRCTQAYAATVEARAAVVDAAAEGDALAALAAYPAYVTATVEYAVVVNLARRATAAYVFSTVEQVDPAEVSRGKVGDSYHTPKMHTVDHRVTVTEWHREHVGPPRGQYRTVHADGVPDSVSAAAVDFSTLLAEGAARLAATHRASFTAAFTRTLADQLEG